jgi:hypothetical protein
MSVAAQRKYHLVEADEVSQEPVTDESELLAFNYKPEVEPNSSNTLDTCSAVGAAVCGPPTRMLVKRSLSADGQVDSVSVTIDLAIDGLTAQEIKLKGHKALRLETELAQEYLANSPPPAVPGQSKAEAKAKTKAADEEKFAAPARLLDIGKAKNDTYFINVKVGGKQARLFGSARQLVTHLASIGQDLTPEAISEGLQLDYACRAVTELGGDGCYLNVVKLLPAA